MELTSPHIKSTSTCGINLTGNLTGNWQDSCTTKAVRRKSHVIRKAGKESTGSGPVPLEGTKRKSELAQVDTHLGEWAG